MSNSKVSHHVHLLPNPIFIVCLLTQKLLISSNKFKSVGNWNKKEKEEDNFPSYSKYDHFSNKSPEVTNKNFSHKLFQTCVLYLTPRIWKLHQGIS